MVGYLSLDIEIPKLLSGYNPNSEKFVEEMLIPHRALYDTLCAIALFNKLLEMVTLYKLPNKLQDLLVEHFLKIEILRN